MLQVASGFAALAVGCDGGSDDSGSGTDGTGSTSTSGGSTSGDGSSSSTGSDETTDGTTSGDPGTSSGSTGGADTGSSSGEGSSSGSSSGGEASLCEGAVVAVISMNHGHALEIPLADIEAGVEATYDASGTSGHCHEVVVTAEDFATLRAGGTVIKYSCNGGDHEFALSCVKGGDAPGNPAEECAMDPQFGAC